MRVHQSTPDSPMREDRETETYVRVCDAVDPIATRALLLLPIAGAIIVPLDAILNPVSQNGGDTILALMHKCLEPGAAVLIPFIRSDKLMSSFLWVGRLSKHAVVFSLLCNGIRTMHP